MSEEPVRDVDIEKVVRLKALAEQCFGPVVAVSRTKRLSFVDRLSAFHEAQKLMVSERVLSYVLLEYLNASINASKLPITLSDGTVFDDDGAAITYIGESEPPVERETEILELIQYKQKDARLYQYGVCIFRGNSAPRNFNEARRFWLKGAEGGNVEAQFISGDIAFADKDYDEAVKWLELAAGKGHTDAIFAYGLCHLDGLGVPKDLEKAAGCARLAAEQGHAHAQYTIGMSAKEAPERVEWLAKSAAQGFAPARKALEEMN